MVSVVKEAKNTLRRHLKAQLKNVSQKSIAQQSSNVLRTLETLESFKRAKSIALFMNMPNSEIQTLEIIKRCFELDKKVYLPRCIYGSSEGRKTNHLLMLKVSSFQEVFDLQPQGKYKLLEPTHGENVLDSGDLDIIVMPGVGFNRSGQRLGHGAGFYDEFLNVYSQKFKRPHLIGVGLREQLIEQLPTENHDWTLDCVVVDDLDPFLIQ